MLRCRQVYTHNTSVMRHVKRMLTVPLSFGLDFQEMMFVDEAPKGSHIVEAADARVVAKKVP